MLSAGRVPRSVEQSIRKSAAQLPLEPEQAALRLNQVQRLHDVSAPCKLLLALSKRPQKVVELVAENQGVGILQRARLARQL